MKSAICVAVETAALPVPGVRHQPKQQAACARLEAMARALGPQAKLPTIVELRRQLDVSGGTLDAALRDLEAQNVIYRRHGSGIYVSPQLHQSVCLVCDPSFFGAAGASPFWSILIEQSRQRASFKRENFSLHFAPPMRLSRDGAPPIGWSLSHDLRDGRVQGVLAIGLSEETTRWIEARQVPLVAFAGHARHVVEIDGAALLRRGAQILAQRGCRRPGLWGAVAPHRVGRDEAGARKIVARWKRELTRCGLPFDARQIHLNRDLLHNAAQSTLQSPGEQGFATAMQVFGAGGNRPDGILILEDLMTHGALNALQKLDIAFGSGTNLKIATHCNRGSPTLLGRDDAVDLLEVDPGAIVQAMFESLEALMRNETPPRARAIAPRGIESVL